MRRWLVAAAERADLEDCWPYTFRVLPWGLAAFMAMLCVLPFDAIELSVSAPIDLTLDRVLLGPLALLWIASMLTGGHRVQPVRFGVVGLAVLLLLVAAVASVVVNLPRLAVDLELSTTIRRSGLLASYVLFFLMVATTFRREEIGRLQTLFVILASITALGVLWEFRFSSNLFYSFAEALFPPPFAVDPAPTTDFKFGRDTNVGPTGHGLALTVLLTLALPFALLGLLRNPRGLGNLAYIAAVTLVLAGAVATLRKTAIIMPAAAFLLLTLMRPRSMVRLLPLGLVVVLAIQAMAPSALGQLNTQLFKQDLEEQNSVTGRTEDFDAVGVDVWASPFFGRGWGSYEPTVYRFLDNQYLLTQLEAGLLGMIAFVGVLLATFATSRRLQSSGDPVTRAMAAAIAAGAFAFYVSSALFDSLTFAQAPYLLFLLLGMLVVLSSDEPAPAEGRGP